MEASQGNATPDLEGRLDFQVLPPVLKLTDSYASSMVAHELRAEVAVEVLSKPALGKCSRLLDESGLYPLAKAPRPSDFDPYAPFDREEKPLLASPTARADHPKFRTIEPSSQAGVPQSWRQPPSRWPASSTPKTVIEEAHDHALLIPGCDAPQAAGGIEANAEQLSSRLPWASAPTMFPAVLQTKMRRAETGGIPGLLHGTGPTPSAGIQSSGTSVPSPWLSGTTSVLHNSHVHSHTLARVSAPAMGDHSVLGSLPGAMPAARQTAVAGRAESLDEALPIPPRGGPAGTSAHMSDLELHREKNRLAQTRFRARRKNQIQESERQLQELSVQMEQLMSNNAFLQSRAAINRHLLNLRFEQLEKLQVNHAVREYEMNLLIGDVAEFMSNVEERRISPEEAKAITLHEWMTSHFQMYIDRLKRLLPTAKNEPGCKEEQQLNELVNMRREHEGRMSIASSLYWAIFAWNYQATLEANLPLQPSEDTWARLLDGLELTGAQEQALLESRQRMFHRLQDVCFKRQEATNALGFALLTTSKESLMELDPAKALQETLIGEHEAVFEFLFTVADEILTPLQEAYLDREAYPWWPDIWVICNLLARRCNLPPAPTFEDLRVKAESLEHLLPFISPFWVLTTPLTALGCGLRLKRSMLAYRYFTVTPVYTDGHVWVSIPDREELRDMTIFDVHWGKFHNAWKLMANGMAALTPGERAQEEAKKASYLMHLNQES